MVEVDSERTRPPAGGEWRSAARTRAGTVRGGTGRVRLRARASVVVLVSLVLAAVLVPLLSPAQGLVDYTSVRTPPGLDHPFGTDTSGRDLFARAWAGLRVSLLVAAVSTLVSTVLGSAVGAVAGSFGGWVDRLLMRLVDAINSVPHLLLGIVIVALYRGTVLAVVLSIGLTHWATVARVVRSEVLGLRNRPYIDAAISAGAGRWWVLRKHVLPAVVPQAVLSAVLLVPHAVFHETALSFLGLGLPPHLASIGNILGDGRAAVLLGAWWIVVFPALLLVATTLAVSGIAAGWRDRAVPTRRSELSL
ncbi:MULTISPECIES: ABC transporter permease [Actinopolyspora]|uniref:Peptide/nickel transport system permease protein n=1 Tax=Actinopolyspora saharensis TaxID=995062 RepID=A0A1H1APZ0_9ACTN|nr:MULTISPECIES: ABC transporter permease [Actinopolyspora]NHD17093.1 ABC transporter permease [Actinopolyspora sp. BKK2]NHE76245.1 ABC transporter permease [Actinopolyspora sp. BKK1]SDQ41818.1 peptide/nickel transport system permease protein [Actinopolyspora saharensis]